MDFLRKIGKFNPRHLWSNYEIGSGDSKVIWELLEDIWNFYSNKNIDNYREKFINRENSPSSSIAKRFIQQKNKVEMNILPNNEKNKENSKSFYSLNLKNEINLKNDNKLRIINNNQNSFSLSNFTNKNSLNSNNKNNINFYSPINKKDEKSTKYYNQVTSSEILKDLEGEDFNKNSSKNSENNRAKSDYLTNRTYNYRKIEHNNIMLTSKGIYYFLFSRKTK